MMHNMSRAKLTSPESRDKTSSIASLRTPPADSLSGGDARLLSVRFLPVDVFHQVLNLLAAGPQCACDMALDLGCSEKDLYPYLAELLARGWITIVRPPTEALTSEAQSKLKDILTQAFAKAQAIADRDQNRARVGEISLHWYGVFKELKPLRDQVLYFLAATPAGFEESKSFIGRRSHRY